MQSTTTRTGGPWSVTRRAVLKGGAASAAALGLSRGALAQAQVSPLPTFDPALFLLDRCTFGLNQDMLNEVMTRGYDGFLAWQLAPDLINDDATETLVNGVEFGYPLWFDPSTGQPNPAKMTNVLGKTPAELFLQFPEETSGTTPITMWAYAIMLRAVHSRRQLFYVMADFWSNVHNRFMFQEQQQALWMPFEENVIYPHALGNYADMVKASAKHASMMLYLNQYKSDQTNPIENFARELMELHTLGIKNGVSPFTEQDVEEVSKILTGWSMHSLEDIIDDYPNPDVYTCPSTPMGIYEYGNFAFKQEKHAFGQKTVLGKTYGSNILPFPLPGCYGLDEGEQLIDDLVARDETAEHLACRLIEWLVMDEPPQALVDRVAGAFAGSGGEIKPMVEELFDQNHLDEIHSGFYQKIRRPVNLAAAIVRATEPDVEMIPLCTDDVPPICQAGSSVVKAIQWVGNVFLMGQAPGTKPSPDGHPGENDAWTGALRERLQIASDIAHNESDGLIVDTADLDRIFGPLTATDRLAVAGNQGIFLGKISFIDVRRIQKYINVLAPSVSYDDLRRECLSMLFSAPSYQYLH